MALHTTFSAFLPRALARADRMTFDEAVRQNQDELYGVALRILGDRDAAQDATSRALLKAFRAWDRYDQVRPVRHWLLRIAANEALVAALATATGVPPSAVRIERGASARLKLVSLPAVALGPLERMLK